MEKIVKARFKNGVIEPLEKIELEEGEEIEITISLFPKRNIFEALKSTAGAWKGTHDPEDLKRNIYLDRLITRREPKL